MSEKKQDIGFNRELSLEEYIIFTACCAGPDKLEWLERGIFWCFDYQDYNERLSTSPVQVSGHNIFNFEAAAVGAGNEIKRSRKIFMDALKRVDSNGARVPQTICVNFTGVPGWTSTRINGVVYRFPAVGIPVKDALKYFMKEQYRVSVYQGEKLVNILASEALDKMPAFMKSLKKAPNGNGLMLRVVPEELVEIRK